MENMILQYSILMYCSFAFIDVRWRTTIVDNCMGLTKSMYYFLSRLHQLLTLLCMIISILRFLCCTYGELKKNVYSYCSLWTLLLYSLSMETFDHTFVVLLFTRLIITLIGRDYWRCLYGCIRGSGDHDVPRSKHLQHGPRHDIVHGGALRSVNRGTYENPRG